MRRILSGVRVLDLTQIVAGPVCTRMLADLGADVIKVDPPARGNAAGAPRRTAGPVAQNIGKRSVVVDLKAPEGVAIVRRIAESADVFVQNYRPGALAALGLGYDDLRQINPRLIYVDISGFGQNTSYWQRGAYGATAHAEAGWLWIQQMAQGGTEPFAPGITVADIATGMNAAMAILAALYDRFNSGVGQHINISLMDSQLALLAEAAAPALEKGSEAEWVPFRHGLQRAKDGYLAINLGPPEHWPRLTAAIGNPGAEMPADRKAAERLIEEWVRDLTVAEAEAALAAADVPYGVMRTIHEALASPYFKERGMIEEVQDPLLGSLRTVSSPLFFSESVAGPAGAAPLAGEHTVEVLEELGYSSGEVEALRSAAVVEQLDVHALNHSGSGED